MSYVTMETVWKKFRNGEEKAAIADTIEYIYRNPFLLGYMDFDEDTKSEFLLYMYRIVPKLLQSYNEERSAMRTYIPIAVRLYVKSWRREMAKKLAERIGLIQCYQSENGFEEGLVAGEVEPNYAAKPDMTVLKGISSRHAKEVILILALKSACSLSEDRLRNIAKTIDFEQEQLVEFAKHIQKNKAKKNERRISAVESRNRSYFFKRKYALELGRLQPESAQYQRVAKQLAFQASILGIKNQRLREKHCMNTTVFEIATLLKISPRTVVRRLASVKGKGSD